MMQAAILELASGLTRQVIDADGNPLSRYRFKISAAPSLAVH